MAEMETSLTGIESKSLPKELESDSPMSPRPRLSSHSYRQAIGGPLTDKYRKKKVVTMKGDEKESKSDKPKPVGFFKLFRYATPVDILLMVIGLIAAFLHGAAFPIAMNVFGDITNLFVNHQITRDVVTSTTLLPCPSNSSLPVLVNVSSLTGDIADCMASYTVGPCTFVISDILTALFGDSATCHSSQSFISQINIQVYAFIAIAAGAFVLAWLHVWLFQMVAERQAHTIRLKYYQTILKQDIGWFDLNSTGELSNRLSSGLDKIHKGIGDNLSIMVSWISTFIAALAVGLYRRWELALFLCVIVPFMAIAGALFARLGAIFSSREEKSYASAGGVAEEVLSTVRTVFAFGGQKKECARYDSHLTNANKDGVFKGASVGFSIGLIYFLIFLVYSVSFWFGGYLVAEGRGQSGDVITVFFAILVGAFYVGQAGPNLSNLTDAMGAAGEIYSTIDRPLTIDSSSETGLKPDNFKPTVELKSINFTYPARPDTQVLHGLDLHADVGHTVALAGSSGSGKSTIVDLVLRFYEASSGQILIGGYDIKDLNVEWLRSQIGLVSQEPVLFDTTIAENIRYGKEDSTMEEIQEAAKSANAHDFISSLPNGYNTNVGEGGELLSGGQKQRIAIARALVRNPKILLLDEATSALDTESERIVQNALDAACVGRTTIVVAHRLSTIQNADVIAVLDKGRVVEIGTHTELISMNGLYSELVTTQSYGNELPSAQDEPPRHRAKSIVARKSLRSKSWREKSIPRTLRRARTLSASVKGRMGRSLRRNQRSMSLDHTADSSTAEAIELDSSRDQSTTDGSPRIRGSKSKTSVEIVPPPLPEVDDMEEESLPDVSFFKIMKNLRAKLWIVVIIGVFASIVNGLIFPAFAVVFGEVLDVFASEPSEIINGIHPWGATFLALGIVLALSSFIKNFCFSITGENLTARVRSNLFKAMLRQEIGWFDEEKNSTGALTTKLSYDVGQMQGAAGVRIGTLLEMTTGLLASLAVAFAYSWITAFVIILFMPMLALSSAVNFTIVSGGAKSSNKSLKEAAEISIESMENIRTVASFGLENRFYQRFKIQVEGVYRLALLLTILFGLTYAFSQSMIFFGYIITFRFGAFIVTLPTDHLLYTQFSNIFRVFAALVFGAIAIGAAGAFAPDYSKAKKSAKIVYAVLDRDPEIDNYSEDGEKPQDVRGEIEFESVFFAYPQRQEVNVLRGMNLNVKPGQTLALVGTSGGGKSTVFSLIERFYDSHAGFIKLDGINVKDLNLPFLRSQIGIVSQEPVLLDASIADNIRYGALFRDVSDEEIIDAAKAANIHSFIETLPMGYNTNVGGKGTQLSGGQKQRVAIARALVRDPKVLLLDEATSALDSESERIVQEALDKAREGRTSIVIAHRLSTIYNSDCIAVLKRGQVAELGTHTELLEKKGLYFKLNRYQLKDWEKSADSQEKGASAPQDGEKDIVPASLEVDIEPSKN